MEDCTKNDINKDAAPLWINVSYHGFPTNDTTSSIVRVPDVLRENLRQNYGRIGTVQAYWMTSSSNVVIETFEITRNTGSGTQAKPNEDQCSARDQNLIDRINNLIDNLLSGSTAAFQRKAGINGIVASGYGSLVGARQPAPHPEGETRIEEEVSTR